MGPGHRPADRGQLVPHRRVSQRAQCWLAIAAIAVTAALAYAPSFAVPFQFDDEARLTHNGALQQGALRDALRWLGNSRVLPSLTLVLNYRLAEFEPLGYHIGNFAVHLLAAFGVFALALTLCRTPRLSAVWPPQRALRLATAAALLFACHPLQTQAVTYIIQRSAAMAAGFYVWTVVCYLQGRIRQQSAVPRGAAAYFVIAAALAVAAVLSKENAVSLPAALLLSEWVGFGRPSHWRAILIGGVVALAMLAVPVAWKTVAWQPAPNTPSNATLPERMLDALFAPRSAAPPGTRARPLEYLLTQATVLPRYLLLAVVPWGLNVDHDVPIAHTVSAPVLAGGALLAALAALALSQMRRRPLAAFGMLWFFVTLSVESSLIPIDDVMVEHRMYLPMAGLAVIGGWLFVAVADRVPRAARAAGIALMVGLIALTFARNVIWLTPVSLWLDAAEKSPRKARPQVNVGVAYHHSERLDEAVAHYCRALELNPDDELASENLEVALTQLGKLDTVDPKRDRQADGTLVLEVDDLTSYCP